MFIKRKIKKLILFTAIIFCGLFVFGLDNIEAQDADWSQVNTDGFGDGNNSSSSSMTLFDGYLYVGTENSTTGGEVWRTSNGTSWSQINSNGFGDANNTGVNSLASFGGSLYAGTVNTTTGALQEEARMHRQTSVVGVPVPA